MMHIAIVEDEKKFVEQLEGYIIQYKKERNKDIKVSVFSDGEDIIEGYRCQYDIILMDIQMEFMDGMTAAEKIRQLDNEVVIIFITNMIQYAVRGYEVDALDYVVKPIEYFAFSQKLDKAIERSKKQVEEYLMVSTEDGVRKLAVSDIYYIESQGHQAIYYTKKGDFSSRAVLKDLENTIKIHGFYRCSKGFLINLKKVDAVNGNECVINGIKIPISRIKRKEFMEKLIHFVNED